jgi:hypothetical protein
MSRSSHNAILALALVAMGASGCALLKPPTSGYTTGTATLLMTGVPAELMPPSSLELVRGAFKGDIGAVHYAIAAGWKVSLDNWNAHGTSGGVVIDAPGWDKPGGWVALGSVGEECTPSDVTFSAEATSGTVRCVHMRTMNPKVFVDAVIVWQAQPS